MKSFLLLLIATLSFCNIFAIDQECIVYQYNGKEPRTPLGGVYVKVTNSPNGAVSQEYTGHLILKLQGLVLGDAMGNVIVRKTGMMVFNKEDVGRWHVQKEPLVLILCDAKEFQKRKEQLIAIGRNLAEKKYKQKMEQLKDLNVKQQFSIDQYCAKLDSIDKKNVLPLHAWKSMRICWHALMRVSLTLWHKGVSNCLTKDSLKKPSDCLSKETIS